MPKDTSKSLKHACEICDKEFNRASDLNRHAATHNGEKPYVCTWPDCGASFSQSSGLKTHLNTHTGAQPHACKAPGCKARFNDPSSCTRHYSEIHKQKGSYECPFDGCHSTIKRRSAFTNHLRTKHSQRLSAGEVDACNPVLREEQEATGSTSRRGPGRRPRRTSRATVRSQPSQAVFRRVIAEPTPPALELPAPLAVPAVPESIHSTPLTSMAPASYAFTGFPFVESSGQPSSSSSMLGCDYQQNYIPAYSSPHISTPQMDPFASMPHSASSNNYLTVPQPIYPAVADNLFPSSVVGSPALTMAGSSFPSSSSSSTSVSPSPSPSPVRLYPTVHHATPEPEYQAFNEDPFALTLYQGTNGAMVDSLTKHDPQMDMLFASLAGLNGFDQLNQNWTMETGYGVEVPVIG